MYRYVLVGCYEHLDGSKLCAAGILRAMHAGPLASVSELSSPVSESMSATGICRLHLKRLI